MYPEIQFDSTMNCYRAVINGHVLTAHSELSHLLDESNIWLGEHRSVFGVPVQNKSAYSLELTHPGTTGTAGIGIREEM
jgi:salicylate hydroxylase